MLPRVNSALLKFLSPIASVQSDPLSATPKKDDPSFTRAPLQLVPASDAQNRIPEAGEDALKDPPPEYHPFIQLLQIMHLQSSEAASNKVRLQIYIKSVTRHRRIGKSRKGVILDHNSE